MLKIHQLQEDIESTRNKLQQELESGKSFHEVYTDSVVLDELIACYLELASTIK
ncbi:hypothetical protein FACS189418_0600 [Clostridia bacterium]|nr:hypothetical protein FACS189418_0600 [Clostridia bacterium]